MSLEQDQVVPSTSCVLDPELLKTPPEPALKKLIQTTLDGLFTPHKTADENEETETPVVDKKRKKTFIPVVNVKDEQNQAEVDKKNDKPKVAKPRARKQSKDGELKLKEKKEGETEETSEEPKKTRERAKVVPRFPGKLQDLSGFLEHARRLNIANPLTAFSHIRGARLCGFFERAEVDDVFTIDSAPNSPIIERQSSFRRYPTDLPEMTTCCKYDDGRYAVWKDDPKQDEILLVHTTKEEHFPIITVIGDRWEHLLFHLAKADHEAIKDLLPKGYSKNRLMKETREVINERTDKMMGSFTGVGYIVPIVGLTPNPQITAVSELKRVIEALGEGIAILRERSIEQMEVLHECVEDANQEGMFGMALEFGHMLWLANYHSLNEKAKNYLVDVYSRLGREAYAEVVTDHLEKKNKDWKKKQEKKNRPRFSWTGIEDGGERRYMTRAQLRNLD